MANARLSSIADSLGKLSGCRQSVTTIQGAERHNSSGSDEEMVRDGKEKPKLQLKNGALADVQRAMYVLEELRVILEIRPDEIDSLFALAKGNPKKANPEHVKNYQKRRWVDAEGKILPYVGDVILSSYEIRGDGPVLVNPFKLETQAEKIIADRAQEDGDRRLYELFFGRNRKPPSRG